MSISSPLVSIVLPTYNGSRYINTSIRSCLEQTYKNIEVIVVDGGSTDGTLDIIRSFVDLRIKIVNQEDNVGRLPGALTLGFKHAKGDLFTWTQDDDYFTVDAIEKMCLFLRENPDIGFGYAGYWIINEEGKILRESNIFPPETVYWTNPVGHCFLYRREVAEKAGEYDVCYLMAEDFHYWVKVYKCSKMALIPGRYFFHRLHSGSLTVKQYGAYWALRVSAKARRELLDISWSEYQRQVANAYIEEAFAASLMHDFPHVLHSLLNGVIRDPRWLRERGIYSIGARSIMRKPKNPTPSNPLTNQSDG